MSEQQRGQFDGLDHDGETFDPAQDGVRLNKQTQAVYDVVKDGAWRTLRQLAYLTGAPEASASSRLRDLRKKPFGGHKIERRRVPGQKGLWEYRLVIAKEGEV